MFFWLALIPGLGHVLGGDHQLLAPPPGRLELVQAPPDPLGIPAPLDLRGGVFGTRVQPTLSDLHRNLVFSRLTGRLPLQVPVSPTLGQSVTPLEDPCSFSGPNRSELNMCPPSSARQRALPASQISEAPTNTAHPIVV